MSEVSQRHIQLYNQELAIERKLFQAEKSLSTVSIFPVIGIVSGGAKALMGVGQSLGGVGFGLCNFIPAIKDHDWLAMDISWTHIKHGLGNITAGIFEAIPILGTFIVLKRLKKDALDEHSRAGSSNKPVQLLTGQGTSFMPYDKILKTDLKYEPGSYSPEADASLHTQIDKTVDGEAARIFHKPRESLSGKELEFLTRRAISEYNIDHEAQPVIDRIFNWIPLRWL